MRVLIARGGLVAGLCPHRVGIEADEIDDFEGETLSALVDVADDDQYEHCNVANLRRSHRHTRASRSTQRAEDRHTAVDVTNGTSLSDFAVGPERRQDGEDPLPPGAQGRQQRVMDSSPSLGP
jgi:hypothetical protein